MVGGRLPVPGHFRFEGKISQVVVFNRPFTLDQIKFMQNFFVNEQIGECLPALQEEQACRAPTVATSSLCTASVERYTVISFLNNAFSNLSFISDVILQQDACQMYWEILPVVMHLLVCVLVTVQCL